MMSRKIGKNQINSKKIQNQIKSNLIELTNQIDLRNNVMTVINQVNQTSKIKNRKVIDRNVIVPIHQVNVINHQNLICLVEHSNLRHHRNLIKIKINRIKQ